MNNTTTDYLSDFEIGTESAYSLNNNQNGGGFLSFFGLADDCSELITEFILDAFCDRNVPSACYLINKALDKNLTLDLNKKDAGGRSILHHIVMYCGYNKNIKDLLLKVLELSYVSRHINDVDNEGNTVAHIALKFNQEDVLNELIRLGVDLSIKNNEGLYIDLKKVPVKQESVFAPASSKKCDQDELDTDLGTELARIIKIHLKSSSDDNDTIGFRRSEIDSIIDVNTNNNKPTEQQAKRPTEQPTEQTDEVATDAIIDAIMRDFKTPSHVGGARKKTEISGNRKLVTYSEVSVGGASTTSPDYKNSSTSDESDDMHAMARMMKNKATEIHDRTVKKIMSLMNVSEEDAKVYKAALYSLVKNNNPELSNFDRATEMEKMATVEELSKVDLEKTKSEMKANFEKKMESSSEKKNKTKKSKKEETSETSPMPQKKTRKSKKSESTATSESGLMSDTSDLF